MSKSRDMEIKLFGRTITSLFAVDHYDPPSSSLSPVHGVSDQSKEASSSSSSSCSPSTGPDRVCHVNPNLVSCLLCINSFYINELPKSFFFNIRTS